VHWLKKKLHALAKPDEQAFWATHEPLRRPDVDLQQQRPLFDGRAATSQHTQAAVVKVPFSPEKQQDDDCSQARASSDQAVTLSVEVTGTGGAGHSRCG
jgi:hypothetical protein